MIGWECFHVCCCHVCACIATKQQTEPMEVENGMPVDERVKQNDSGYHHHNTWMPPLMVERRIRNRSAHTNEKMEKREMTNGKAHLVGSTVDHMQYGLHCCDEKQGSTNCPINTSFFVLFGSLRISNQANKTPHKGLNKTHQSFWATVSASLSTLIMAVKRTTRHKPNATG